VSFIVMLCVPLAVMFSICSISTNVRLDVIVMFVIDSLPKLNSSIIFWVSFFANMSSRIMFGFGFRSRSMSTWNVLFAGG